MKQSNLVSSHSKIANQYILSQSLHELVGVTSELNDKIKKFVEEFRVNKDMEQIDTSNSDDQRHFFTFPDLEQFRCSVPRPAENLIFQEGAISVFKEIV